MKRNTQLAELTTQVKHNTLHKATARGALGRKMVVNRTKKSLCITWVKTTHRGDTEFVSGSRIGTGGSLGQF